LDQHRLTPLLKPASIAIVGASPSRNNVYQFNSAPLEYLVKYSYDKKIFPINPKYEEINGYKCYPSILDVPDEIDCALLIVSAKIVGDVLKQCEQKGVKSVIVTASGFAETGEEGAESQRQLRAFSERTGIPILGPNTLGLVNVTDGIPVGFSVALEGEKIRKGNIGFVSQSGATMSSIVVRAKAKHIGFSYMIATGNEAALDIPDFIHYLLHDDSTEVITVVAESIKNMNKFMAVADEALKVKKPIVMLKLGRTNAGKITALSHTGSMAGSSEINDALFRQKNIVIAEDIDDMLATAELLACKYNVRARGVGVASTSGGGAGLTADLVEKAGLDIPKLADSAVQALKKEVDSFVNPQNPYDFVGQFIKDDHIGEKVFRAFASDPNIGLMLFTLHPVQSHCLKLVNQLIKVRDEEDFPSVLLWIGGELDREVVDALREAGLPWFTSMSTCARAIANLIRYHDYLGRLEARGRQENVAVAANRDFILDAFAQAESRVLSERISKTVFREYGLAVTKEELATTPEEAVEIARRIGYPVALKIDADNALHKTDIGGVKLNVRSDDEVREHFGRIVANYRKHFPDSRENGVLVQEMVEKEGIEFILGMKQDPECGPAILFGLGGIFTEMLKEFTLAVLPLNPFEADLMLENARFKKLFDGFRGMKVDYAAVKDFILRFAQFCWDYRDRIEEVDINPLYAFRDGSGVIALDALIRLKP